MSKNPRHNHSGTPVIPNETGDRDAALKVGRFMFEKNAVGQFNKQITRPNRYCFSALVGPKGFGTGL